MYSNYVLYKIYSSFPSYGRIFHVSTFHSLAKHISKLVHHRARRKRILPALVRNDRSYYLQPQVLLQHVHITCNLTEVVQIPDCYISQRKQSWLFEEHEVYGCNFSRLVVAQMATATDRWPSGQRTLLNVCAIV